MDETFQDCRIGGAYEVQHKGSGLNIMSRFHKSVVRAERRRGMTTTLPYSALTTLSWMRELGLLFFRFSNPSSLSSLLRGTSLTRPL